MTRSPKKWRRLLDLATRIAETGAQLTLGRHVEVQLDRALLTELRATVAELHLQPVHRPMTRVGDPSTSAAAAEQIKAKLGQLQRARAAELTDLTQAYADLTKDESP